ncbi:tetratricopeptide repeat protein [Candidatus Venteria ishoeyi]|uniref:tetratricopeptide repeat protein n=1 Tax=Candidatus Venteria ishoeyi TaxID=1899563 RepID=UPI0025A558D4|nr:tetratricopeptide repeat protein [Candidatus Venteria ishoeyi]MDM8547628.1 tetratricopeptide repeat protein [Candidatus Venteria ishoeyi]
MDKQAPIYEGSTENFPTLVLENSEKGPVLVYFWAEWAGPCHKLFPLLFKLSQEYGGKFLLVNINTDAEKTLAKEYAINSIPTLKLFRRRQVVATLHGPQPENDLCNLLNQYVAKETDQAMMNALSLYQQGQVETALAQLAQLALDDPDNLQLAATLGKLLMAQGRYQQAQNLLKNLPEAAQKVEEIRLLLTHLSFILTAQNAPDMDTLQQSIKTNPDDLQLRYQLAALFLHQDAYENALVQLLEILKVERDFENNIARQGILAIFSLLGNQGELVEKYRQQMMSVLMV